MAEKVPVIELFGPVYQGEGPLVGTKTWFLRTGGCDYLCSKCDSMHAVDPEQVKANRTLMSKAEIVDRLVEGMNKTSSDWVTFSGGNPVMWDLTEVVERLQGFGKSVAVETQGSLWRNWIAQCDSVVISPKGPGMGYGELDDLDNFMVKAFAYPLEEVLVFKIPILELPDIAFAKKVAVKYPSIPMFLSVGNQTPPMQHFDQPTMALAILRWAKVVEEKILQIPELRHVRVFPQQHVLVYGNEKGR